MICCVCKRNIDSWIEDSDGNIYCSENCFRSVLPKCSVCGKPMNNWTETEDGKKYCSEKCYESTLPTCSVCGKPMNNWTETEDGKKYCSEKCYESRLPKCSVCGKPMNNWTETEDGKKYCSEKCYESTLPTCSVCGKPMNNWTETEDGKKYCSEKCYESRLPKCSVCGKPMNNWTETEDGKKYCSEKCYESTLPTCSVCGKRVYNGILDNNTGKIYCDEKCYESTLPKCEICGSVVFNGYKDDKGKYYCSERCYETTLPKCLYCGKSMTKWIETSEGNKYCNETCYEAYKNENKINIDIDSYLTAKELSYITGLTEKECIELMSKNNLNGDEALEIIDIYMQSLNNNVSVPPIILSTLKNVQIHEKLARRLSQYNTMRGGVKGYKGFVFEELHAADSLSKGIDINVLADNGIADFVVIDSYGNKTFMQAKAGYKPGQIDWNRYKKQKIVVDKGNKALLEDAKRAGLSVEESSISLKESEIVARTQQLESKLTGKTTAPITARVTSVHKAGLASAKMAAKIGVGFKIGENIFDVIDGEKTFSDASVNIVTDTIKLAGGAYIGGVACTLTSGVLTTMAETTAGIAITQAVAGVGTAVAGTAVGGSVLGGIGTVATVASATVTTITSAPLLPIVATTAVVGFAFKGLKKWLK